MLAHSAFMAMSMLYQQELIKSDGFLLFDAETVAAGFILAAAGRRRPGGMGYPPASPADLIQRR